MGGRGAAAESSPPSTEAISLAVGLLERGFGGSWRTVLIAPLESGSFAFIGFLVLDRSAGVEEDLGLRDPADSAGSIWFVTPAKEQLALVTKNGFHEVSFR